MEKEDEKELYVPANCPPLDYIVNGFTGMDMTSIVVCVVIGVFIAINIGVITGNTVKAVFFIVMVGMFSTFIFHRDRYGENVIDKIAIEIKYVKSVKEYLYEYVDVYKKSYEKIVVGEKKNGERSRSVKNSADK